MYQQKIKEIKESLKKYANQNPGGKTPNYKAIQQVIEIVRLIDLEMDEIKKGLK